MSKQQDYQQLSTEVPSYVEDYGFPARLPHAGVSYPTHGAYHANLGANCTCGAEGGVTMAYPASTYAGADPVGYPAGMPITAPVGMVVQESLGRCGKKRARRMACAANGCRGCRNCRGCHGCHGAVAAGVVQCICCLVWPAPPSTRRRTTTGAKLPRLLTSLPEVHSN